MPTEPSSVLFVITRGDSIGGGQIHVRDLCQALQARGVRVAVAAGSSGALQEELDRSGIRHFLIPGLVRSINPLDDLVAIAALRRRLRMFRPDLVSCHTAKAGMVGRLAAFLEGIPVVFTAHGWQFAEGIAAWQKYTVLAEETVLSRMTRRIITVSGYDRDLALHYRLGTPRKVILVHNGMPWLDRSVPGPGASATVRLVMVARFQEQKDHATLFAALERLEDLPWSLELIGDGPDLGRWQEWVASRGWGNRVRFSGQVLDVPNRLAAADVFVLASLWEGFPRSILEAMRAGLPVVVSDVGGVRESVLDGQTGYVVPARDADALADRLADLMADGSLRRRLGDAGRVRFEDEFTFEAMLTKTLKVWEAVRADA
jgi:glycosyltransferase involved in cell wall biosynthesis